MYRNQLLVIADSKAGPVILSYQLHSLLVTLDILTIEGNMILKQVVNNYLEYILDIYLKCLPERIYKHSALEICMKKHKHPLYMTQKSKINISTSTRSTEGQNYDRDALNTSRSSATSSSSSRPTSTLSTRAVTTPTDRASIRPSSGSPTRRLYKLTTTLASPNSDPIHQRPPSSASAPSSTSSNHIPTTLPNGPRYIPPSFLLDAYRRRSFTAHKVQVEAKDKRPVAPSSSTCRSTLEFPTRVIHQVCIRVYHTIYTIISILYSYVIGARGFYVEAPYRYTRPCRTYTHIPSLST